MENAAGSAVAKKSVPPHIVYAFREANVPLSQMNNDRVMEVYREEFEEHISDYCALYAKFIPVYDRFRLLIEAMALHDDLQFFPAPLRRQVERAAKATPAKNGTTKERRCLRYITLFQKFSKMMAVHLYEFLDDVVLAEHMPSLDEDETCNPALYFDVELYMALTECVEIGLGSYNWYIGPDVQRPLIMYTPKPHWNTILEEGGAPPEFIRRVWKRADQETRSFFTSPKEADAKQAASEG